MASLASKLFARIIARNRDVYLLKVITLAMAFASSVLITVFSLNEFGYDRFHNNSDALFRILKKNMDETYTGNKLSAKIPRNVTQRLSETRSDSLLIARVKTMKKVTVGFGSEAFSDQTIHAVDHAIMDIFSLEIISGENQPWHTEEALTCLISSRAALKYTGDVNASGKFLKLYSFADTLLVKIGAVFHNLPQNSHEHFELLLLYNSKAINTLGFDPNVSGVYGKVLNGRGPDGSSALSGIEAQSKTTYLLQPLVDIYFGPRIPDEDARHGDAYSIALLISIVALILFLAISTFMNLTTLSLPNRAKEIAVKKLSGMNEERLLYSFLTESCILVGIALVLGLCILVACDVHTERILGFPIVPLLLGGDTKAILVITILFTVLATCPLFMILRFIRAAPNHLLSTETITFPQFKRTIAFLQLGICMFLIIVSVVVRRQINYSLLKEPGRNHDQVVYLNPPAGITNEGITALRSGWKKSNPNVVDVMAVSQLPDRISSKEIGSKFYLLQVDAGFLEFFDLAMEEGNWFKVNAGDSLIVTNKKGKQLMAADTANVIGIIKDFSEQFNQPSKPLKIRLGSDYNYNWLCVRVLEVDIRRTISRLSQQFTTADKTASVHLLNERFEEWLNYQDQLNLLSGILAVISALLSCCAVYGLSISIVRDKTKQIGVLKLYGAEPVHIIALLMKVFAKQMLLALVVFAPVAYIFLNELLRNFVYATELQWLDVVYPIAFCAVLIAALSVYQGLSLNRSDLTGALKGQ